MRVTVILRLYGHDLILRQSVLSLDFRPGGRFRFRLSRIFHENYSRLVSACFLATFRDGSRWQLTVWLYHRRQDEHETKHDRESHKYSLRERFDSRRVEAVEDHRCNDP